MNYYKIINGILHAFRNTIVVKAIDKILSKIGFIGSMERTHVDTFTEDRIQNIKGELIAKSNYGQIWFKHQELGGYFILNTIIISGTNIKSEIGSELVFKSDKELHLVLKSDEKKIESNFSNVSNRWITEISYYIKKTDIDFINERLFDTIQLDFKNNSMPFLVL